MVTGSTNEEPNSRRLEQEIRDMVASLTRRLTTLSKSVPSSDSSQQGTEGGVRIITLAGDNKGATMKAGPEDSVDTEGMLYGDDSTMSAFTNSNYQAVNNSIMLGGSCQAEDPGVHVVITDYMDDDDDDDKEGQEEEVKKEKKDKEKKKEKKMDKKKGDKEEQPSEKRGDFGQ